MCLLQATEVLQPALTAADAASKLLGGGAPEDAAPAGALQWNKPSLLLRI